MQYEINYLVLQSKTGDLPKIREEIKNLLTTSTATVTGEKNYLKRKLAYEIKHEAYGFFTVLRFELEDKSKLQDVKKDLNLHPGVSRYIIVKADELPALEEAISKETAEQVVEQEQTIKQSDVEKMITQTKTDEPKPTEVKPAKEETKAESEAETVPTEEKAEVTIEQPATEPEEKKQQPKAKPIAEKEESAQDKEDQKKKEEKASLEELDKKLDEILNI